MVARLIFLTAAVLLVSGCGGENDAPPAPSVETEATSAGLESASTASVAVPAAIAKPALLTDVRAARHSGYDRVVFAFANGLPGYEVGYVERPLIADGSGDEVAVDGAAVLRVRMEPALDTDLSKEPGPPTYTGPTRFSPDGAVVAELVRTGGFEAVLVWAVGVDGERPFRVTMLAAPPRLVVDVDAP
jgi:hypothetical protein